MARRSARLTLTLHTLRIEKGGVVPGTLTRWDPFAELGELRSRFDRIFDEWLDGRGRAWTPAIDVMREDGHLVVRADLPGFKPEQVKIEVEDDILTISGEHEERTEDKDEQYVRRERRYGSFSRSMTLPGGVDANKIKASTRNGVVELKIPLPKEASKAPVRISPTVAA
jgi:HSP20 family protein